MKAILEFNLHEDQDELEKAQKGYSYYRVLEELDNYLRSKIKYGEGLTTEQFDVYNVVREKLYELRQEEGV